MIDLLDDPNAGIVMRHFHETSKPTAVLCHGPISLLSALPNSTEVVAALLGGWPTFTFSVKVGTARSDVTAFLCRHA
jgi:putative intracellular protease/amidase